MESFQLVGGVISAGERVWSVENIWTGCWCVIGERHTQRERERETHRERERERERHTERERERERETGSGCV